MHAFCIFYLNVSLRFDLLFWQRLEIIPFYPNSTANLLKNGWKISGASLVCGLEKCVLQNCVITSKNRAFRSRAPKGQSQILLAKSFLSDKFRTFVKST